MNCCNDPEHDPEDCHARAIENRFKELEERVRELEDKLAYLATAALAVKFAKHKEDRAFEIAAGVMGTWKEMDIK